MMKFYQKSAYIGIFLSLAVALSYIELIFGFSSVIPIHGLKLGFYNIAVIVAMFSLGSVEAFIVIILRSVIMSTLFGTLTSFVFSVLGGIMSFAAMSALIKSKIFNTYISIIGVSVAGAVFFSSGQIIASMILTGQTAIIYYLPVLLIGSVFTGTLVGVVSKIILLRLSGTKT